MTQATATSLATTVHDLLEQLGVSASLYQHGALVATTPLTGETLAHVPVTPPATAAGAIETAHHAFLSWRTIPAPRRGELVRLLGEELRANLEPLGQLVTIETGKLLSEGLGEVQEMIDICVFATGLSRQIGGLTPPSERAHHRMMETWHPLGVVGIISAFNFPVAVWSWNAALALICGNSVVWKPSEKTPLTALATQALFERAARKFGGVPRGLSTLLLGDRTLGEQLIDSPFVPLVSATGSTGMGRAVAPRLAARFARAILELGGNNAAIVAPSADLDLTVRAVAFSAMGTAGQRCTSMRRLFIHESIYPQLIDRLKKIYRTVVIGDPRDPGTLVGPLIDHHAFTAMQDALSEARAAGATITGGEQVTVAGSYGKVTQPSTSVLRSSRLSLNSRSCAAKPSPPSSTSCATPSSPTPSACRMMSLRACRPPSLRSTCARPSSSSLRPAQTAASPTSTSGPPALRLAEHSVAKRKPAAAANPARTPGNSTCGAPPTPSTTAPICRSPRASASISTHNAHLFLSYS